jgi:hypothetical protein
MVSISLLDAEIVNVQSKSNCNGIYIVKPITKNRYYCFRMMELKTEFERGILSAFVAVYCGVLFSTATKLRHFSSGTKKPVALLS